jgi:lactate permease
MAMGFSPTSAISIAVLGYDPTTSFSLLSIPITLPAEFGATIGIPINPIAFAFKISIFLPLVSTGFAFAILWFVGGKQSMRNAVVPATICGLTLAFACFGAVSLDYFTGVEYVPLRIVGVIAGLCAMVSLYLYQRLTPQTVKPESESYPSKREILRSFSPWIILTTLAAIISIPQIGSWLMRIPDNFEKVTVFADQIVDFDILSQIYTWIFIAIILSIFTLRMTREQIRKAVSVWLRRFLGPFLAYSLYFSVAFVMADSARIIQGNTLIASSSYNDLNMNVILGSTLATLFGAGYIFVAASLGLFGAVVGGSETSSNVLFLKIQKSAADKVGLNNSAFMTVYGSHAVAGGIASAVTPAKINNAVVTIGETHEAESLIMRKHLIIALLLTVATGILTGILVNLGI